MSRLSRYLGNLGLLVGSLALFAVVTEAAFRYVLPASDYPSVAFVDRVMRYQPNQRGVYRVRDEIAAPYRINAQGWNSRHAAYAADKPASVTRVAIVGDSFVEAFQVPYDRSLAEQLEDMPGARVEAYRFGISGAPFSQYVWMLEHAALAYRPDVVVVNLVHNDFDESVDPLPGRYTRSFMTLAADGQRIVGERQPEPYVPEVSHAMVESAALRYLRFNRQVTLGDIQRTLVAYGLMAPPPASPDIGVLQALRPEDLAPVGGPSAGAAGGLAGAGASPPPLRPIDANIDLARVLSRPQRLTATIDYLVGRLAALQRARGFRLLLLMDGARQAIYEDRGSYALRLNRLAAEAAQRHGVALIDLHPLFAAAWQRDRQRFDFVHDGHWNERGHGLAARAIRDWIDRP